MSNTMLTQEQIDAGLRDAKAAVERGRKAVAELRATRTRIGLTTEKVEKFVGDLPPRAQVWIKTIVASSLAEIRTQPTPAKATPRKPRVLA